MLMVTPKDVFDGARFFRRFSTGEYLVTRLKTGLAIDNSPRVPHKFRAERQGILIDCFTGDAKQIARGLNLRNCQSDVEILRHGKNGKVLAKVVGRKVGIQILNLDDLVSGRTQTTEVVAVMRASNKDFVGASGHLVRLYFESIYGYSAMVKPTSTGTWLVTALA
jgi:hypothetical protein